MDFLERIDEALEDKNLIERFVDRTSHHIQLVIDYAQILVKVFPDELKDLLDQVHKHDHSKYSMPELIPYIWLTEFHRCKDAEVPFEYPKGMEDEVNKVTLHHIRNNRHHPEFHDPDKDIKLGKNRDSLSKMSDATKMSDLDIAEMVCDWAAMGREKGTSLKEWADKNVNKRWRFSSEQVDWIYELIEFVRIAKEEGYYGLDKKYYVNRMDRSASLEQEIFKKFGDDERVWGAYHRIYGPGAKFISRKRNLYESKRFKIVFHATEKSNLPNIKKHGFDPSKSKQIGGSISGPPAEHQQKIYVSSWLGPPLGVMIEMEKPIILILEWNVDRFEHDEDFNSEIPSYAVPGKDLKILKIIDATHIIPNLFRLITKDIKGEEQKEMAFDYWPETDIGKKIFSMSGDEAIHWLLINSGTL